MFSSNLAHITPVLVSCSMLGSALVYIAQKMRDTIFVLGGGNECSVAMAGSCAASFYNQASPCHHKSAMQKTHWDKKKPSIQSEHFAYDHGSFLNPLLLHNPDIWISAGGRVAGHSSKLLRAGVGERSHRTLDVVLGFLSTALNDMENHYSIGDREEHRMI